MQAAGTRSFALRATQTASQVQVRLKVSCSMLGPMARAAAGEMIQTGGASGHSTLSFNAVFAPRTLESLDV